MSLITGDRHEDPRTAAAPRRGRRSLFNAPDAPAADAPKRQEWNGVDLESARERFIARRAWRLTQSDQPLAGGWDADGHAVLPPELLAKRADEAAEAEAERVASLTTARLDATQTRRWNDWLREFELHRPAYLRLCVGPRGEWRARQQLAAYEWSNEDQRHPDGGRVAVRGVSSVQTPPLDEQPRAYPNERVLEAIRTQLLTASWLPAESRKPTPPRPTTIDENLAAMAAERASRSAAKRQPGYNWRLIIEGGRGW